MARSDRFYIGQKQGSGLQTDLKPFAIPDEAFAKLNNAYVWRGRVKKRFGARLMPTTTAPTAGYESLPSRLRIQIGTTSGAGALSGTVPGTTFEVGQSFSVGDEIFTSNTAGVTQALLVTGSGAGTYSTTNGAFAITGAAFTTAVYFYTGQPVMGIINYEDAAVNDEPTYAFDTQFSYQYTSSGWDKLDGVGITSMQVWTGNNSDFFWGANWQGITSNQTYLFVTNYTAADGIKYFDGTDWTRNVAGTQIAYRPVLNNINRLMTARIVIPFKDRLIALNTIERAEGESVGTTVITTGNFSGVVAITPTVGGSFVVNNVVFTIASSAAGAQAMTVATVTGLGNPPTATFTYATETLTITGNNNNPSTVIYYLDNTVGPPHGVKTYVNRCRFSWNGSPIAASNTEPNAVAAWLEAPGLGGYIDAPTKEAIVTAQFLYDRLIVYFERSTWELVYTGNQILPFVWQRINTELGAESTFSQVPFDKVVLGVGNVGIHACDGSNVNRVDQKIPNAVFEVHNTDNALKRVAGIRDFFPEMVYWTFPDELRDATYPFNNKVLVYNYKTGSWAFNDDSITAFGYFQASTGASATWQELIDEWQNYDLTWRAPAVQAKFRSVIAGNQQGYTFIIDTNMNVNSPALQITDMTTAGVITCNNHNLASGDYVKIEGAQGNTTYNDTIFIVSSTSSANSFSIGTASTGTYSGGGVITRVSQIDIYTKQYNFYLEKGYNTALNKVDFLFDTTANGQIAIDYFASTSNDSWIADGQLTGALIGNGLLDTSPYSTYNAQEINQSQLWHSFYPIVNGEYVQMRFYLNGDQMLDVNIAESGFVLHALMMYTTATGSRLQ